jgi:hypothetical protein
MGLPQIGALPSDLSKFPNIHAFNQLPSQIIVHSPSSPISLTHNQAIAMHEAGGIDSYRNWRSNAPEHWREDKWFSTRVPIFIGCRYGQDEDLSFSDTAADHFHGQLRWQDMKWLSYALAVQVEYVFFHF